MDPISIFKHQSAITDPKEFGPLYDELPNDIVGIGQIARGLIVHFFAHDTQPAPEKMSEVDSREVPLMLNTILKHSGAPLSETRLIENKLVGCCRDFATLTVSILRHKGTPARVRYGTATYFEPGYFIDHAIVEYWDADRNNWRRVDTQLDPDCNWGIDPFDVKADQFISGADGWLKATDGVISPGKVGLGSIREVNGWAFLLLELQLDVASLNKVEMLCWDAWGISKKYKDFSENLLSTEEYDLLFEAASAIQKEDFQAIRRCYNHPLLKLSNPLWSFSPAINPRELPKEIELEMIK